MIPDNVTLFAIEQNMLPQEERQLRLVCGCLLRTKYLLSWDSERWIVARLEHLLVCQNHKVSPGTGSLILYLTEQLVELNDCALSRERDRSEPRYVSPQEIKLRESES